MTEAEWLSCAYAPAMATYLGNRISARKGRLFDVACCRRLWHLFGRAEVRGAILVGERYADGEASDDELRAALRTLQTARAKQPTSSRHGKAHEAATYVAVPWNSGFCLHSGAMHGVAVSASPAEEQEQRALAELVREFFGNPFRSVRYDPAWLSAEVEATAKGIYADHDLASMPVLADALEDAGCDEAGLLGHCRSGGPHYRGCWALDLILGKR
jgi:hypothetical protein